VLIELISLLNQLIRQKLPKPIRNMLEMSDH